MDASAHGCTYVDGRVSRVCVQPSRFLRARMCGTVTSSKRCVGARAPTSSRGSLLFEAEPCMLPSAMLVLAAQPLDPEVYCTACNRLVANLQDTQGLVPMLRSAVTLAKTTKPELGALDALAEEYVIERGCKWYATWNNLTIRKACLHITEEYGESLVEKITRWATKERSDLC